MESSCSADHNRDRCRGNRDARAHREGAGNHGNEIGHTSGHVGRFPETSSDVTEVSNNRVDKNRHSERDHNPDRNHPIVQLMHHVFDGEDEEEAVGCMEVLPSDIKRFLFISYEDFSNLT